MHFFQGYKYAKTCFEGIILYINVCHRGVFCLGIFLAQNGFVLYQSGSSIDYLDNHWYDNFIS